MVPEKAWWSLRWRVRHAGWHPLRWLALLTAFVLHDLVCEVWELAPAGSKLLINPWLLQALQPDCTGELKYLFIYRRRKERIYRLARKYPRAFPEGLSWLAYGGPGFFTEP